MATQLLLAAATALLVPAVLAITPEGMLAAPRYTSLTPNPTGEWAVYSFTNYSWEDYETATFWKLMDLSSGDETDLPFSSDVSEMIWIGDTDTSVLYVNGSNDEVPGGVTMYTADLAADTVEGTFVASLPAPYSGLKAVKTDSGDINFLVNCLAYANNGTAYNEDLAPAPLSTGLLYDSTFIRHWDAMVHQERYAVFSGVLSKSNSSSYSFDGTTKNLLSGMDAPVTRPESPVQPFGGSTDYDISPDGSTVVFLTKAPELAKANYTASYLYLVPHDGSSVATNLNGPGSSAPEAAKGASGAPLFSPDGTMIAYNQMDGISYESDRAKIYIADVASKDITLVAGDWDASAATIKWSPNCEDLFITSDWQAATRIFTLPADAGADYKPQNLTDDTDSVSDFFVLPGGDNLVSANAVWSSMNFYTLTPDGEKTKIRYANEEDAALSGLGPENVGWFWYNGTLGDQQQGIIVYPSDFDPSKVYDMIFYIHGGPQGYTGNVWSSRWNLKTWADQGYVLIGPNPTGSTSYGQSLTDRIQNRWGSWPYEDLKNAHSYACENIPYVNCSNAVEAGASYGGFMTNWIQGHSLGREFKALVCHDGMASPLSSYSTEELWFIEHDFNGTIYSDRSNYERFDPIRYGSEFATPQFIVHSDLDYRLDLAEGLMMFNILKERGVPSRFLYFPDESHWVLDRENSRVWHGEIFNWINFWTGKVGALDGNAITE